MTSSKEGNYLSVKEFLELVIRFERDAAQFYRDLREKLEKEEIRELLSILEGEEIRHEMVLREFEQTGDVEGFIQFPPEIELSMPDVSDSDTGVDAILDIAIEREKRACLIYKNAATVSAGSFKSLLEGLAAFEKEHEKKLKSFKSYY
jgi:rubrerythrin